MASQPAPATVEAGEINADFSPLVYDILRAFEKEQSSDPNQKQKDSQETEKKIIELYERIQLCREQILKLPGVDQSQEDQASRLEALKRQLVMKKELLEKYRGMCAFEVSQDSA